MDRHSVELKINEKENVIMEEILDNGTAVMDKLEKAFEAGSGIDELIREFEQIQPDIQKLEEYYTGKYWQNDLRLDA